MARLLSDMGKTIGADGSLSDTPIVPDIKPMPEGQVFLTMGENARYKAERAEAAKGVTKPETPSTPPGTPPTNDGSPPTSPPATPPPAPPATPPTPPPAPEVKVEKSKRIEEIVEGVINRLQKEPQPPAAPAAPPAPGQPAPDPDAAYIETLDDSSRDAVELARYAAKKDPKYATLPAQMVAHFKRADAYIEKARRENKDWEPEEDTAYQEMLAESAPNFPKSEQRRLERQMITESVVQDVEARFAPKIQEAERLARTTQIKPELDKAGDSFKATVADHVATDPNFSAAQADGLATGIANQYIETAADYGREVLALSAEVSKVVQIDPRLPMNHPHNVVAQKQANLFQFIENQEQIFLQQGGDLRVSRGRQFTTRALYAQMSPAEQAKHWVFQATDVLDMLKNWAQESAKTALQQETERLKRAGYVRAAPAAPPKTEDPKAPPAAPPAPPADPGDSPKAKVAPSPGVASPPPAKAPQPGGMSIEELQHQWGGGPAMMRG